MTAILPPHLLLHHSPSVVIKVRNAVWVCVGVCVGWCCPLLVLSSRMHLNNWTVSYWQPRLDGRQSWGGASSFWSILLSSPKVQMKWLKLRLCKREEAHSSSCRTLGSFYLRQSSLCAGAAGAHRDCFFLFVYLVFHLKFSFQKWSCPFHLDLTLSVLESDSEPDIEH